MKKILKYILPTFLSVLFVFGPSVISLSSTGGNVASAAGAIEEGLNKVKGEFPASGKLTRSQTVGELIINIIRILLTVTMAVAVLFIIIGGYQYITSAGSEERAGKGKKTLINAIIGLVLIIMAYAIVSVVNGTLTR